MFTIEKGIPAPAARTSNPATSGLFDTFKAMEVGDSVLTPPTLKNAVSNAAKLKPKKFASRKQPDGSTRIWRTA